MKLTPTTIALAIAVLFGMGFALYTALTVPIIADAVNPMLYAYEFWHGNMQWYVPVNDPYVLDYAINIITAPLLNYEPRALFVGSWLTYAGIVLLAGLCARRISGKKDEEGLQIGLAAAAIAANTGGAALQYMVYPVWHGTTLFLGLLALYIYFGKGNLWKNIVLSGLLLFGTFCDTLFLPVFVAPLMVLEAIKLFKTWRVHEKYVPMVAPFLFAAFGYLMKREGGAMWPGGPYIVNVGGLDMVMSLIPQPWMIPNYADGLVRMAGGPIAFAVFCLALLFVYKKRKESREMVVVVAVATMAMLVGFLFLFSAGGDLGRYLFIIVPMAGVPIALLGFNKKSLGLYLIPILIVAGAANNTMAAVLNIDDSFKEDAADFLVANNVTDGYADYWLANLMRCMSQEEVKLRPVFMNGSTMEFLSLQSTDRWPREEGWPREGCPVVDTTPTIVCYGQHDPCEMFVTWLGQQNITPYETLAFSWHDPQTWEPCYIHVYKYNTTFPSGPIDVPYWERFRVKPV